MIQSVKRTFDILEYVAANGNLVRLNDIAQALGLQKTTVHNFLAGLKELGYVEQDELTPRYRITSKIQHLDFSAIPYHQLRTDLKPVMEKLTAESGETSFMAIQLGSYFRYEWKCEPNRSLRISLELGKEFEMKHTAIGKVFMAYSPHLSNTIYKEVNEIRMQQNEMQGIIDRGYAIDLEEYEKELNCIAVPYFYKDRIISVIGLSGPAHRFDKSKMEAMADFVKCRI
ncbi:IclR family transcriptional regulator [Dyadobacter psychrotolerans]|uniref:IclR family transcriptional regulator n=1 Tax=Dyadobacter psychrotolerans TaxID=2541721 RepID=A0A4R5DAK0_9BACT|nr:IclR family transcriptional regulator [Dyadobacter psychrotolerans]TDE08990.1 IclR family transcriptional regulator [Dyadobacter psychrotolerans]